MPLVLIPEKKQSDIDFEAVTALARELQCDPLFARILWCRGFQTAPDALRYLHPEATPLEDPFTMLHMREVCDRILLAKDRGEQVVVYGDYDVDGVTAAAILLEALLEKGISASCYLPDRHTEGYGLHEAALEKLFEEGCGLLVTVDCGIASGELIAAMKAKGREIIVTDHHSVQGSVPDCLVLKPGQPGDTYSCKELCGAGIAFKLACALLGEEGESMLDMAAVATVADVVPLTGENRTIVRRGLEKMNISMRPCYRALLDAAGMPAGPVTSQTVAFTISPRLNAAGRMDSASLAFRLLRGETALAAELCRLNSERQAEEKRVAAQAEEYLLNTGRIRNRKILMAAGEGWEDGVIGICAARLAGKYHRPCLLFAIDEEGNAKGSGRSVPGIDLFRLLDDNKELFSAYGGHQAAAGMSLSAADLEAAEEQLDRYLRDCVDDKLLFPQARYDAKATASQLTADFCRRLSLLEPVGNGNPEVVLRLDDAKPYGLKPLGSEGKHLRGFLQDETGRINMIAFGFAGQEADLLHAASVTAIGTPEMNVWQGTETPQLRLLNSKESERFNPAGETEELTAAFYSRLAWKGALPEKAAVMEDFESFRYAVFDLLEEDISGTLMLCDHPEAALSALRMLREDAPRCNVCFRCLNGSTGGYHTLLLAADPENTDFRPFRNVVVWDMVNPGYLAYLASLAPHASLLAMHGGEELFSQLQPEYRTFGRAYMLSAYKAIRDHATPGEDRSSYLTDISREAGISRPLLSAALDVFTELGFFRQEKEKGFCATVLPDAPHRKLEESALYQLYLKNAKREEI